MTSPSPNSDAFSPSRVVARLAEERDIDLSKVKFKVRSSSDVVAVEMLYDGKRIGGMNAHKVRYPEEKDCPRDVTALAKRFPELVTGEWKRSDGEVWRYITALAVFKAFITDEEFRGYGLGKKMYKTLMVAWFKKVGPFLFMPYKCDGGSGTSTDAMRVWHSLSKEFPSSGDVVAVMKNPRVARSVQAARPIRLPTREIKALAKKLAQRIHQLGLPKAGRVIAQEYLPLTNVMGDEVEVEILLTGTPGRNRDPFSNEMLNGGFLKRRPEGPVMRVFVNPHLDPRSFEMRPRRIIENELYRILTHELTHAADVWSGKGSVGDLTKSKDDLKRHHHNHPAEVRALMRDVVTEVEPTVQEFMDVGMTFNMAVKEALKDSKWVDIEPYLTPRNKKTILKGVFTHMQDQGLSKAASRTAGGFRRTIDEIEDETGLEAKVEAGADSIKIELKRGAKMVGYFRASTVSLDSFQWKEAPTDCKEAWGQMGEPPVWIVRGAEWFDPDLRGKGFGKLLYKALFSYIASKKGVVGPNRCSGGNTSPDAQRVWKSLRSMYPKHGPMIDLRSRRIGSRTAARPIRLDRRAVNELVDGLKRGFGKLRQDKDEPLGTHRQPIARDSIAITDVLGNVKAVKVVVISKPSRSGEVWIAGGFGHMRKGGQPVIIIEANAKYPLKMFLEMKGQVRSDLFKTLMHELTHAADVGQTSYKTKPGDIPSEQEVDNRKYYNDPKEVRAYMRELYEELRPIIHKVMDTSLADDWGKSGAFNRMLGNTQTWKRIEPHLTPRNKKKILKGVITAFEDEGWTSPKRVASRFADCNPRSLSHSWIDPKGKVHPVPLVHAAWAEEKIRSTPSMLRSFVKRYREYYPDELYEIDHPWSGFLIDHGWVRVANFLNFEGRDHLVSQHAWDSAVDLIIYCMAKNHQLDPETTVVTVAGYGKGRFSVSQIVREWGGRKAEDRLFGALRARTASGYAPDSKQEVENWVEDFGYENNYTPGTCDLNRGDCDMMSNVFADWFENQTGVGLQLWAGQGFIPPLGKDANDLWIELTGDQAHKRGEKPLSHVVAVWGKWVIDLTGRQFGSKYRAPVYPLSEFKKNWAATGKTNRANRGINNLRRMMLQHN